MESSNTITSLLEPPTITLGLELLASAVDRGTVRFKGRSAVDESSTKLTSTDLLLGRRRGNVKLQGRTKLMGSACGSTRPLVARLLGFFCLRRRLEGSYKIPPKGPQQLYVTTNYEN